jgi:hypothetical protein
MLVDLAVDEEVKCVVVVLLEVAAADEGREGEPAAVAADGSVATIDRDE